MAVQQGVWRFGQVQLRQEQPWGITALIGRAEAQVAEGLEGIALIQLAHGHNVVVGIAVIILYIYTVFNNHNFIIYARKKTGKI